MSSASQAEATAAAAAAAGAASKSNNDDAAAAAATRITPSTPTAAAATANVNVKGCKSVMDFLHTSLPKSSLLDLYEEPSSGQYVCQAVFQRLPEISQQVIIRLMCTGDGKFPLSMVKLWLKPPTVYHHSHLAGISHRDGLERGKQTTTGNKGQ